MLERNNCLQCSLRNLGNPCLFEQLVLSTLLFDLSEKLDSDNICCMSKLEGYIGVFILPMPAVIEEETFFLCACSASICQDLL